MTTGKPGSDEQDHDQEDRSEQDHDEQDGRDETGTGQVSEAGSTALNEETAAGGADSVPDTPDTSAGDDLPPGSA
jgi:hypothetical protein